MPSATDDLLAALQPLSDAYPDTGQLAALAAAAMTPVQLVDDVVRGNDTQPAWQTIRDPDTAPTAFLGWLAQHAGVELPTAAAELERRDRIKQAAGFYNGTGRAIQEEVARTLSTPDPDRVRVFELVSGDQWAVTVITRTADTPNPAAAEAAARSQKPAGIVMTFLTSDEPFIDEFTRTIDAITAPINSLTVADVT